MAIIEKAKLSFDYENANDMEIIKRSAETLFSIRAGTLPMDRSFGLQQDFVGMPMPVAQNLFTLEATEKVEKYIPEATIVDISWEFDETEGKMYPSVILGPAPYYNQDEEGE